ncbi:MULTISPECIES: TetR/AcrR family transcriptional regulator [Geobacillus]|jgi:AcrR family transcriptional regulator|nr:MULTISPECIES: TetR/AcrR family transcriptional regulator [Geobacillus]ARA98398.1 TetR family transcriptional regulator [Geobacillus thermodenitrificans]ATO37761.1 TetR family transcriptional regulator [Geobacillus thermodenitrificans]MED0663219.1 TetR/AcrR family transcriptional regulator [Geobacillus thermodenitrificans]MED3718102.1 TetR/AcrR family transcriptional regulator [Geobacillus thermodenitrificans]MED3907277.1 TetR/AcrR family transcriptional regulator [Geobacillus thermodenitrif
MARRDTVEHKKTVDRRHMRSAATRQKILQAAREVFIREGFHHTTVTQIIKKAGVGYGTAYVYFKGKDDILITLMEDVMGQFYQIAELPFFPTSKEEAQQMIQRQAYSFLKMAEAERDMLQVFEQAIGVSQAVSAKWAEIRERFVQRISQDISYSQRKGLARTELNPELVARGWFFTNEMYLWDIVRGHHRKCSIEEIARTITAVYTEGLYR